MPLERDGGQAQFIMHEPPTPDGATLETVLRWMEENAHQELRLEDIAAHAMMSTRTFSRRFHEQTSTTPLQWLNRSRLHKAQCLLETTDHSIEWIASHVGFGSSTAFRDQFKHLVASVHRHTDAHSRNEDGLRWASVGPLDRPRILVIGYIFETIC